MAQGDSSLPSTSKGIWDLPTPTGSPAWPVGPGGPCRPCGKSHHYLQWASIAPWYNLTSSRSPPKSQLGISTLFQTELRASRPQLTLPHPDTKASFLLQCCLSEDLELPAPPGQTPVPRHHSAYFWLVVCLFVCLFPCQGLKLGLPMW